MEKYECGRCGAVFVDQANERVRCVMCDCVCAYKVPYAYGDSSTDGEVDISNFN
jgi:DNA-directed RNA polymerase subunit RPC12/RpoP